MYISIYKLLLPKMSGCLSLMSTEINCVIHVEILFLNLGFKAGKWKRWMDKCCTFLLTTNSVCLARTSERTKLSVLNLTWQVFECLGALSSNVNEYCEPVTVKSRQK